MADDSQESADYPSGPITCCLQGISKRVKVREDNTWTVSLMIAWISSIVSMVLFITAFGTVAWAQAISHEDRVVRRLGLWQECHSETGCSYISAATNIGVTFKVSQALSVLILVVLVTGTCLTVCYAFIPDSSVHARLGAGGLWCRLITFLLLLIFIPIFAKKWWDPKYSSSDYKKQLGYSFKLAVVSFCLEFVGALFMYCDISVFRKEKQKPLLEQTRTVEYNEGFQNGIFPSDTVLHPSNHTASRLEEQVFGHINAKTAYENFTNRNNIHMSKEMRASQDSLFKSKEEIDRRFTGITLAEPEYTSMHGIRTTLNTTGNETNNSAHNNHALILDHNNLKSTHESNIRHPKKVWNNSHQGQKQHGSIAGGASIQSKHSSGVAHQRDHQGRLITSVSMYDLHNESFASQDTKTASYVSSHHASSGQNRSNMRHPDGKRHNEAYKNSRNAGSGHNGQYPQNQQQSDPNRCGQRPTNHDTTSTATNVSRTTNKSDGYHHNQARQPNNVHQTNDSRPAGSRQANNKPVHGSTGGGNSTRGAVNPNQQYRNNDNRNPNRASRYQNIPQDNPHQQSHPRSNRSYQEDDRSMISSRSDVRNQQVREGNRRTPDNQDTQHHSHHGSNMAQSTQDPRLYQNQRDLQQRHQQNQPTRQHQQTNLQNQHQQERQRSNGPVAPARKVRDRARASSAGNPNSGSLARAGSETSLHSVTSNGIQRYGADARGKVSSENLNLSRMNSTKSISSMKDNNERVHNGGAVAPALKVRDHARAVSTENLNFAPLTRAQSTTSLHSVISTATTIVDGCAESEI